MSSLGRSNLLPNQSGIHTPFWVNPKDYFDYSGWENHINTVYEEFDIPADQATNSRGNYSTFKVDRRGDQLTCVDLLFKRTALSLTANSAFEDWEAYTSIDRVEVSYNGKLLWKKDMFKRLLDILDKPREERAALARLANGDLSFNERRFTSAEDTTTSGTYLVCSLGVPWEQLNKSIVMLGLPNKIEFKVYWKTLQDACCGSANTGTLTGGTITDPILRCGFYHLPEDLRQKHFNYTKTQTGIINKIMTEEYVSEDKTITGAYPMRLVNIRNSVYAIKTIVRGVSNVTSGIYRDLLHFLPHDIKLKDNGSDVTNNFKFHFTEADFPITHSTHAYHKFKIASQITPSIMPSLSHAISILLFCPPKLYAHCENHCVGSRNISGYNNPEIEFSWNGLTAATTDYFGVVTSKGVWDNSGTLTVATESQFRLEAYGEIHNIMVQKMGDLKIWLS